MKLASIFTKEHMNNSQKRRSELGLAIWAVIAAFGCYFCMYAFRKPFTAASYSSTSVSGIDFKTILVITQVFGYMLSKFAGIKFIAEMPPHRRAKMLVLLVGIAESALFFFGIIPRPWNAVCLFFNGLTLGLVFGLVMGFLEGRRFTEALAAGLCASFILADGVTKSTGALILSWGWPEDWIPFFAGGLYFFPFLFFVWMLTRVPPPTSHDIAARNKRPAMHPTDRTEFWGRHYGGIIPIVIMFLCVTLLRSARADFAPEIWRALGDPAAPSTFSLSEIWVALGVIAINGSTVLILENRRAFFMALGVCGCGIGLLCVALLAKQAELISSFSFMVLLGLGLYLPYVAVHTTIFERLLAMTREPGNIGFLMYVADAIGYLGYVLIMLVSQFRPPDVDFVAWFKTLCWLSIGVSTLCLVVSWRYYSTKYPGAVSHTTNREDVVQALS